MRVMLPLIVVAGLAGACTQRDAVANNTAAAATNATDYRPTASTSRAEFGGRAERRFKRMDKNGDLKLDRSELPERMQRRFDRMDTNGDGSISSEEFGAMMLQRFDRQDRNGDGTLTADETRRGTGRRNRDRGGDAAAPLEDDTTDQ